MTATAMQPTRTHHVEHVMGMAVTIDIRDVDSDPIAIDQVVSWLHHVDGTFSTHKQHSMISQLGRHDITPAQATDEVRDVLQLCENLVVSTGGAFNPYSVAAPNGTNFDPSGVVKGWAVDMAASLLERLGCEHFCITAGGDIALRGMAGPHTMWRIGIDHPYEHHSLATVVETGGHVAIATSGTCARGMHIIDPTTGLPATELVSATVIGPDLALADAYATALIAKGSAGLAWIDTQAGYEAFVISAEHQTAWTDGFADYRPAQAHTDEAD